MSSARPLVYITTALCCTTAVMLAFQGQGYTSVPPGKRVPTYHTGWARSQVM
jgi:hypothetical protein